MELKHTLELLETASRITGIKSLEDLFPEAQKILTFHDQMFNSPPQVYKPIMPVGLSAIEFANHYMVQHPIKGPIKMKLHPFQEEYLKWINDGNKKLKVSCVSRQMGFTSLTAAQTLWLAINNRDCNIVIIGTKFAMALEIMERIRFAMEHSDVMMPAIKEFNKGNISFNNGSRIIARACSKDALRGLSPTWIFIQDAAFISYNTFSDFWQSLIPLIDPTKPDTPHLVIHSTPYWSEGPFYTIWQNAVTLGFQKATYPWTDHPDRDAAWAHAQRGLVGDSTFAREYECQWLSPPLKV